MPGDRIAQLLDEEETVAESRGNSVTYEAPEFNGADFPCAPQLKTAK